VVAEIMGILGGIGAIFNGIFTAIGDALFKLRLSNWTDKDFDVGKQVIAMHVLGLGLVTSAVTFPLLVTTDQPSGTTWATWAVTLVVPSVAMIGAPGIFAPWNDMSEATKQFLPKAIPFVISALSATLIGLAFADYVLRPDHKPADDWGFAASALAPLPGLFAFIAVLIDEEGELILAILDVLTGLGVGVAFIVSAVLGANPSGGPADRAAPALARP
jgi:hypothetical protein